jgi:hypothetical protein
MLIIKKLMPVLLLGALLTGCATSTITNLTSKQQFRNENGFYPIEAAFNSSQQSLRWETIKPITIVSQETYPMHLTTMMTNRWETLVPIPPSTSVIYYRFKFDYNYNAFGAPPRMDSRLSQVYRLQILDK